MNDFTSKISARQLYCLIFVSRATVIFYNSAFLDVNVTAVEYAISAVVGLFILLFLSLLIGNKTVKPTIISSPIIKAVLVLLYSFAIVEAFVILSDFFKKIYKSDEPVILMLILSAAVVFYSLTKGIEGLGRLSFLVALVLAVSLLMIIIFNASRFDITKLSQVSDLKGAGLCAAFIRQFVFLPEIFLLFSFAPYVDKPMKYKSVIKLFAIETVVFVLLMIFFEAVLARLVFIEKLPINMLSSLGEFSVLRRLDSSRLCIFIVVTLVKIMAFSQGLNIIFRHSAKGKNSRCSIYCVMAILVFLIALSTVFLKNGDNVIFALVSIASIICSVVILFSSIGRKNA